MEDPATQGLMLRVQVGPVLDSLEGLDRLDFVDVKIEGEQLIIEPVDEEEVLNGSWEAE